jgi:hypothetical protein
MIRSSRRSRSARYCASVVSASRRRRPISTARSSSSLNGLEGGIAGLDGVTGIAQQMRDAHLLPLRGVAALAAQHVRHPDQQLGGTEQVLHNGLAAAGADAQRQSG